MTGQLPLANELAAVFARMSGLLPTVHTLRTAMELVTSLAAEVLPGTAGAGISLMDARGRRATAAATDVVVERADALQYDLGEGPCLTAWEQHSTVRMDDVALEDRWPRWTAAVAGTGLTSCVSTALVAGDTGLGAIKVYSAEPENFGPGSEYVMQMFAAQAATLVGEARGAERAREVSDDLRAMVRQRDVVSLAKGILMDRERVGEEDAFVMLIASAQDRRVSVHEAAEAIVRSTPRRRR
nr:hypothetical protein DA06_07045 [Georgenia sp. SUBG003]